jgi:hypothetical protein
MRRDGTDHRATDRCSKTIVSPSAPIIPSGDRWRGPPFIVQFGVGVGGGFAITPQFTDEGEQAKIAV